MINNISLCGDDCSICPRYNAKNNAKLTAVAKLWQRVGWRDRLCSPEEMKCSGCGTGQRCGYGLLQCTAEHAVERCEQCEAFPCDKIGALLSRSAQHEQKCRKV